jgi:hypothetical protein
MDSHSDYYRIVWIGKKCWIVSKGSTVLEKGLHESEGPELLFVIEFLFCDGTDGEAVLAGINPH